MKYHGQEITLDNYKEVFSNYSLDTLDEIRSALFDSIPILKYIDRDPWDLHQIRLAMIESLPVRYFRLPGDLLYLVRVAHQREIDTPIFNEWLVSGVTDPVLKKVLEWECLGYPISGCDFRYMREDCLGVFEGMLDRGVDISPYLTAWAYDPEVLGMYAKLDNPNLLGLNLSLEHLQLLLAHPCLRSLESFNKNMSLDTLESLVDVLESDLPGEIKSDLSSVDSEGYFHYSSFQLDRILEAFEEKLNYRDLLDPTLGTSDINNILLEFKVERKQKFGGRLGRKF